MAYWYDNPSLYSTEKAAYDEFQRSYKGPWCKVEYSFDAKKRFVVLIGLTFRVTKDSMIEIAKKLPSDVSKRALPIVENLEEQPWRIFKFYIVYEHDFPGRDSSGMFGGSIKVYPMTKLKPGFHHLIPDHTMGTPYLCQASSVESAAVNGYTVMERMLGFLPVYVFWEKTGIDIDSEGRGTWRK